MPEATPGHYQLLFIILGTTVTTVGPLLIAGIVGFVKLSTKVDLYRLENTKDHQTICGKLTDLNGSSHENAEAIVELRTNCSAIQKAKK